MKSQRMFKEWDEIIFDDDDDRDIEIENEIKKIKKCLKIKLYYIYGTKIFFDK